MLPDPHPHVNISPKKIFPQNLNGEFHVFVGDLHPDPMDPLMKFQHHPGALSGDDHSGHTTGALNEVTTCLLLRT